MRLIWSNATVSLGRCETELILAAAPDDLAQHPAPQRPEDLTAHHCIQDAAGQRANRWELRDGGKPVTVPVGGNVKVN